MSSLPAKGPGREAVCGGAAQEVSKKESRDHETDVHFYRGLSVTMEDGLKQAENGVRESS